MLKKTSIALVIFAGLIIIAIAAFFIWSLANRPRIDKNFLSQLKGEVVFTRSKPGKHAEIFKYNFQDQSVTKIYQCDGICRYPKWSEDGKNIIFYQSSKKIIADDIYQVSSEGKDLKLLSEGQQNTNKYPRAENTIIRSGDLFLKTYDQEKLIYDATYDGKFYMGVSDVSWSPDERYLIFTVEGYIVVADRDGKTTKLTQGSEPDWKY